MSCIDCSAEQRIRLFLFAFTLVIVCECWLQNTELLLCIVTNSLKLPTQLIVNTANNAQWSET